MESVVDDIVNPLRDGRLLANGGSGEGFGDGLVI